MELIQLRYFVTIAETMSFTNAARVLHVSQPALSYQMKRLEDELGTQLFDRRSRKIAFTPDGDVFLPLAQTILLRADEAVRILEEHLGVEVGDIRIGCNPSVSIYLVPRVLTQFRRDYPRVRVEVVEGGDGDLQELVQRGAVEFAIVTAPGAPQTLDVIPLGSERLFVIVPGNHRFADRSSLDLAALANDDFVLASNMFNVTTQTIDACRRAGFEPRVAYRASSIEAVKSLVRHGLGVSISPQISLGGAAGEGLCIIEVGEGLGRELNLIVGKDRSITRAASALMALMRTSLTTYLRQPVTADATVTAGAAPKNGAGEDVDE